MRGRQNKNHTSNSNNLGRERKGNKITGAIERNKKKSVKDVITVKGGGSISLAREIK